MIYQWKNMTHAEIDELIKKNPWVIVPVGSTEQHGSHLPVGTDALIVEAAVVEAGKWVQKDDPPFVALPALQFSKSVEHMAFSGTITLSARTLLNVIDDVVGSLARHGLRRIILVNGHGGNIGLLSGYLQDLRQSFEVEIFFLHTGSLLDSEEERFKFDMHAGEVETSLLMAWYPELVKKDSIPRQSTSSNGLGFIESLDGVAGWGWATEDISPAGYIGSPQMASESLGKALAERMGEKLYRAMKLILSRQVS